MQRRLDRQQDLAPAVEKLLVRRERVLTAAKVELPPTGVSGGFTHFACVAKPA